MKIVDKGFIGLLNRLFAYIDAPLIYKKTKPITARERLDKRKSAIGCVKHPLLVHS